MATLPKRAQNILERLEQRAADSKLMLSSITARQKEVRAARWGTPNLTEESAAELDHDIANLQAEQRIRAERSANDSKVVAHIRRFLAENHDAVFVEAIPPARVALENNTISSIRTAISEVRKELAATERAPATVEDLMQPVEALIEQCANCRLEPSGAFTWPTLDRVGDTGNRARLYAATINPDGYRAAALAAAKRQVGDKGDGLSTVDRKLAIKRLSDDLLQLERIECLLCEWAEEAGENVVRRPNCSPLATLDITRVPAARHSRKAAKVEAEPEEAETEEVEVVAV